MNSAIRATVRSWHPTCETTSWSVSLNGSEHGDAVRLASSWAEAMQLAYLMIRDRDRELMDRVRAERAARRATPAICPSCELEAAALGHDTTSPGCTFHRVDTHTMEASA